MEQVAEQNDIVNRNIGMDRKRKIGIITALFASLAVIFYIYLMINTSCGPGLKMRWKNL